MKFIAYQTENHSSKQLGGKAKAFAELQNAGLNIPEWFVVVPKAFHASLNKEQLEALTNSVNEKAIRCTIENIVLSNSVQREIAQALKRLCSEDESVAVRSSAIDEDGATHSFAGQLESFLFVNQNEVASKVVEVWKSGFSERILVYRRENGLPLMPQAPAVLIQRMINADTAGVAFGADPITGRRSIAVISAVRGVGASLVSGESNADTCHVNQEGKIIKRQLAGTEAILSDVQIKQIAELVRATSHHFNRPQDIEWAIENGKLYLLQSRPITTLANLADPDGTLNLWDNSNIAESYGGMTMPLTFSFARRAYEEVYRQFCRVLRVPASTIHQHDQTFKNMLGLIRGRVYYNLLNWYRVLAMLPGFKINRRFMEQMMGVKEGLPVSLQVEFEASGRNEKLRDGLNLLVTTASLLINHFRLPKTIRAFYARLDEALREPQPTLVEMRADELAKHYRELEAKLLKRWDAPLINDFLAMIFYGLLRRSAEKWCQDVSLHNDLLCGEGGMISAEPAERLREMALSIKDDQTLIETLGHGSLQEINYSLASHPKLNVQVSSYLAKFGDRCLDELKLESATLNDDPTMLFRSIGQMAKRLRANPHNTAHHQFAVRKEAENKVKTALVSHPMRDEIFNWVLGHARARVLERENLRFERTRVFGRVRRIFVELGKRFYAENLLDDPRDIFYLEVEEALGFVTGTTTTTNLKALVAIRKAEFTAYANSEAPADRFETRGIVHQGDQFQSIKTASVSAIGGTRQGLACCPGIVRGKVRVVTDPRHAVLQAGEILVAERTDPGWVMLFPSASGLLVERGSLLSHSAIVAREMGIPAIVSIPGITKWLKDGDEVEMDGSTGVVKKV
ncbi:MAG TPA: PEP/pyruvate-binding domain-containing protein, partial [Blastocatellia bacterium]|nr:PEP/pyruvate-binding domain-containing protein [Blastocatellia bacterium]